MSPKNQKKESFGHIKLKKKVSDIFERCGFVLVDTEVKLDLDEDGKDDYSFDVCALCKEDNNYFILAVECRDKKRVPGINKEISAWQKNRSTILDNKGKINVICSDKNKIVGKIFKNIIDIKLGYAFTDKLSNQSALTIRRLLQNSSIIFWDSSAVKYFDRVSTAIESSARHEIYREFNIFSEAKEPILEPAVRIRQPGYPEMFLLGMHPGLLLKIGYVTRRTSQKPLAYQRLIKPERIKNICRFFSQSKVLLPNSIILVFDDGHNVHYDKSNKLEIPIKNCSAWIIDGQHRVYGFAKTRYEKWSRTTNDNFKIPVVAFRSLSEVLQCQTFVNINYYQKKIDPTLFCDLSTITKNLKNELTWPSLLGAELNRVSPWKNMIKISEFDTKRSITLSSFSRYALLEILLGYNKKSSNYNGPLYKYAPFDTSIEFNKEKNKKAFNKQYRVLKRFFLAIENKTKDKWINFSDYSLTKTTGVNALMLVFSKILEKYPDLNLNLEQYLEHIGEVDFSSEKIVRFGGGWQGFKNFANHIIFKLNKYNQNKLKYYRKRKKITKI